MRFAKYHALGNDYLVLNPADYPDWTEPNREQIRVICHRNFGVGSDGILWGPLPVKDAAAGLRIFNPDGSEAEKSGNGLRIFARHLWKNRLVSGPEFAVATPGGTVQVQVRPEDNLITVAMGRISFQAPAIPVTGEAREVINETLTAGDRTFTFCAATIGNPHCVIPLEAISPDLARRYGPAIETHLFFPRRINVQFLQVLDRANIRIEIWERGAGYTLASGSSSSAAAAVARRLGLIDEAVTVHMPGGQLQIAISDSWDITMTGPVTDVADGDLHADLFRHAAQA
jgi:diaminopimelate epimerase